MRPELTEIFAHLRQEPDGGADPVSAMRAKVEGYGMGCSGAGLAACQVVPVRIDPELKAAIDARAVADETTTSEVIREALRRYLEVA